MLKCHTVIFYFYDTLSDTLSDARSVIDDARSVIDDAQSVIDDAQSVIDDAQSDIDDALGPIITFWATTKAQFTQTQVGEGAHLSCPELVGSCVGYSWSWAAECYSWFGGRGEEWHGGSCSCFGLQAQNSLPDCHSTLRPKPTPLAQLSC